MERQASTVMADVSIAAETIALFALTLTVGVIAALALSSLALFEVRR